MAVLINRVQGLKEDLITIDPYYNDQQLKKIYGLCINTVLKIREQQLGLAPKTKGRPKAKAQFKDTKTVPENIQQLAQTIKERIQTAKKDPLYMEEE